MALKKPTTTFEQEPITTDDDAAAPFEATGTVAVEEKPTPAVQPKQEPEVAKAQAAAATTTALAKASSTAVAAADAANQAKSFQREVEAMKGASDFSFGNYPLFKANNGEIVESNGDKARLGRWAQVRLLSWDERFEISPSDDGASSKDFVAYSKDGRVVDSVIGEDMKAWVGRSVEDYLKELRDGEGFDKAKVRKFVDTACALLATDSGDGPIGTVIQISLSESSIPAFKRYQEQLQMSARCAAMGIKGFNIPDDPFTFFFIREAAEKGAKQWTKLKIAANLPAKV